MDNSEIYNLGVATIVWIFTSLIYLKELFENTNLKAKEEAE